MSVIALSIHNLHKTYRNGFEALKGISLEVAAGDFFALLGPNGAGKSTAIGIIASLTNKTAGNVAIFGHDIGREREAAKQQIGLVPQEFNFNQWEPVVEIIHQIADQLFNAGRRDTLAGWIDALPEELLASIPQILLHRGKIHMERGEPAAALAREDEARDEQGLPYRFALPQEVSLGPDNSGTWETLPTGRSLWRLRISNPGALSLNLGFAEFRLPRGGRLVLHP